MVEDKDPHWIQSKLSRNEKTEQLILMGPQILLFLLTPRVSAETFWQEGCKIAHRNPSEVFPCPPPNCISARKSLNKLHAASSPGRLRLLEISLGCAESLRQSSAWCSSILPRPGAASGAVPWLRSLLRGKGGK